MHGHVEAAPHGRACGVAHGDTADVQPVRARLVRTEGARGVQVAKARLLGDPYIVRVEIALRPAELVRDGTQLGAQSLARLLQLPAHLLVLVLALLAQIPARMRMGMAV